MAAAVLVLVGAAGWALVHGTPSSLAAPTPSSATTPVQASSAPTTAPTTTAAGARGPLADDLVPVAAPDQRSFLAVGGHILIFMMVRNVSTQAVGVNNIVVPQVGAFPDSGSAESSAQTANAGMIGPGSVADLLIRTRVDCDQVLAGPAVTTFSATEQHATGPQYAGRISLRTVGDFWDEARTAACHPPLPTQAITVALVPGSLVAVPGTAPRLTARIAVHDRAGLSAVIHPGLPLPGLTESLPALRGNEFSVDGGSTRTTPVTITLNACPAGGRQAQLAVSLRLEMPTGVATVTFPLASNATSPAWSDALAKACR